MDINQVKWAKKEWKMFLLKLTVNEWRRLQNVKREGSKLKVIVINYKL